MILGTRRFLTGIIAIAVAALFPAGVFAQASFSVSANSATVTGSVSSYVDPQVDVTNNLSTTLNMNIAVTENNLPAGWSVTICLANCFAPGITNVNDQLEPGQTYPLKLSITTDAEPASGSITVVLKNVDNTFDSQTIVFYVSTTATGVTNIATPRQLTLAQNYPNPVSLGGSAVTTIAYAVPRSSNVTLKVYNLLGKEVRTLVNEQRSQGMYTTIWDGRDSNGNMVAPGVYIYKLANGRATQTRRMLITR